MTARRKPRFNPSKEEIEMFCEYLVSGKNQTEALKLMGWQSSNYYHKRESDSKFRLKIESALARYNETSFGKNLSKFLEHLEKGMDITVAIKAVGWATQTFYDRRKRDSDFARQVDAAIASYETKVHESKLALIQKQNPRIVAHELTRLDAKNSKGSYRDALEQAMKKAISELDFEKAEKISKQIGAL